MPLPTIPSGNVTSGLATGFNVANSCRFNDGDSAYMHKTMGTPTNAKKFTISMWLKRGTGFAAEQTPFHIRDGSGSEQYDTGLMFETDSQLRPVWDNRGAPNGRLITNQMFRDPSAWYHIVYAVDTTQATGSNRQKLYVNGSQVTSFAEETIPSENGDCPAMASGNVITLGRNEHDDNDYYDGYMAEVVFIDGLQLAPTSFGEYDEDSPTIWKPIDVSGLTFGTNGFYLDFEDSSNLGNDANGGTDLTEVNLAAADQATDTPTNNFCTMNPLDNYYQEANFSEGNNMVELTQPGGNHGYCSSTFGVAAGLWYFEAKPTTGDSRAVGYVDILQPDSSENMGQGGTGSTFSFRQTGQTKQGGSSSSYGSAYSTNDIIGVYLDLTANKAYFSINGTLQNSGTGLSITAIASTTTGFYKPGADSTNGSDTTWQFNFGGCPAFAISSGNTDDNGYGNFEYSPNITGDGSAKKFYSLCTKNLAEYG